jgi:hypothetical protein
LNTFGGAMKSNFTIRVQEAYSDLFKSAAQFNAGAVFPVSPASSVQVGVAFDNIPSALEISGCSAVLTDVNGNASPGGAALLSSTATVASPTLTVVFLSPVDQANVDVLWVTCTKFTASTGLLPLPLTPITARVFLGPTGTALFSGSAVQTGLTTGMIPRYQQMLLPAAPLGVISLIEGTTTAVSSFPETFPVTVTYGTPKTFTATVTSSTGARVTAGTVTFKDITTDTTLAANLALNTNGQAEMTATLNAGTHVVAAIYNPDPTHSASGGSGTITVRPARLMVTADSKTITYGGTTVFTAKLTGFVNGDTQAVVSGGPAFTTNATTTNGSANAGTWTITPLTGTLSALNYTFGFNSGTLTVNKALLTVVADSMTMTVGGPVPELTATITGFVNGDSRNNPAVLSGSPALSTTGGSDSDPDLYLITVTKGTLSAPNYDFVFVNGILTIQSPPPAAIAITSANPQRTVVNTPFAVPLRVAVSDLFGRPIRGFAVSFTAPSTGPSLTPINTDVRTDANGIASLDAVANTISGAYSVTARAGGTLAADFQLRNDAGAPAMIVASGGTPQTANTGTDFSALEVMVRDKFNNPVPDTTVTFTTDTTSRPGATFPRGNTAVTDSSGQARIVARANFAAGTYTVTAASGTATPALFTLTNTARLTLMAPALVSGAAHQLGIAWTNASSKPMTLKLSARGYDGQSITGSGVQNPSELTIPAGGQIAQTAAEIFGAGILERSGWLELTASDSGGSGFFVLFDNALSASEAGSFVDRTSSRLVFPHVNKDTVLHVVNTGARSIPATAVLAYDNNGTLLGNSIVSLPAQGGWTGQIGDVIPSLQSVDGYVVFDTQGGPFASPAETLAGMESYQRATDNAIVIGQSDSELVRTGYAVHVAGGAGYSSRVRLVNPTSLQQEVQLTLNGVSVVRRIAAFGRLDQSVEEMFTLSSTERTTGYLKVQTLGDTAGLNGFVEIAADGGVLTSVPIQREGQPRLVFSHIAQGDGYFTGLALLNAESSAATVKIEVESPNAATLASKVVVLQPGERLVGLLGDWFPEMQNQMSGSVRVTSTQPIYGLEIFGSVAQRSAAFLENVPPGNF